TMAKVITDTKVSICRVEKTDVISCVPVISQPGGWALLVDGASKADSLQPTPIALGTGGELIDQSVEISATMKALVAPYDLRLEVQLSTAAGPLGQPVLLDH